MVRVTWTDPAVEDLEDIRRHIRRASAGIADSVAERIVEASVRLGDFPLSGRIVPEVERQDIREVIHGRYRIMYHVRPDEVQVIAVIHGARPVDPRDLADV